ncbi:MAG: cob(I)yrinic acid a,c-diamide adenosyltransferase [Acidobacteria bacterium]|nr:cob(I)yrinic acid a,c-diamide adenosyltransferase [Acidobacteriota bacterium]
MDDKPFHEPRLALNRIYTRRGDGGETSLAGGRRVRKDAPRIECYGTVDELNSFVGMARATAEEAAARAPELARLAAILLRIEHELFNLGSILATLPEDVHPSQPRVTETEVARLEREIDAMNQELPPLGSFVLPGGSKLNAELHACRAVCRRAERLVVALSAGHVIPAHAIEYLNRLSDAFFVFSRWANRQLGVPETLWEPNP